jgi:hypothetical protein
MSDDLLKSPLDEVFDTQREVERNPCGAWQAIQSQADRIEQLAAINEELEAKLDNIERELLRRVKDAEYFKKAAGSGTSQRREHYRMHALSEALGAVRKIVKGEKG